MKKLLKAIGALLGTTALIFAMASCGGSSSSSSGGPEVDPGKIGETNPVIQAAKTVADKAGNSNILYYYRPDGNYSSWGLWCWSIAGNNGEPGYNATKGKIDTVTENGYKIGYWNLSNLVSDIADLKDTMDNKLKMGFLIRDGSWNKDPGNDQFADFSVDSKFLVLSKDTSVYALSNVGPTLTSAVSVSKTQVKVALSVSLGLELEAASNGFVVTCEDGTKIEVVDAVNYAAPNDRNKNNATTVLLTLANELDTSKVYTITREGFGPAAGVNVVLLGAVKDAAPYKGNDLGLTLEGKKATFKSWAPAADDVKLLLYATSADVGNFDEKAVAAKNVGATTDESLLGSPATDPVQMVKDEAANVWSVTIDDVSAYKYYKYQIVNAGKTYFVSDIWGKACSADAIASQIVDINSAAEAIPSSTTDTGYGTKEKYYNPFGKSGAETKAYTDAVIYEMHITDWSYAEDAEATGNVGKYLTIANGDKVIKHIKDLGVTHVQILPVFEFAETNANENYNWGYNPYHYNVPEGRYVTVGYEDGTQAVLELRTLIAKLHEEGIAVNMDVVYNHTSGTGVSSLYDSTVPSYFYRFTEDGAYSNGSGCGNETDSEAVMFRKYMIDSLKHWMLDYHFNGFRFDLMGVHSKEAMAEIYEALHEIDPNVMVYGEPWTGGTAMVEDGAVQAVSSSVGYGAGAFDDDFRDAVKGAEFGGFKQGMVQGTFDGEYALINGLCGKPGSNKRNDTGVLGLGLRYVECHDNYTLFDKLAISFWQRMKGKDTTTSGDLVSKIGEEGVEEVRKEDKLAGAYVLLSQGTAFLNGGQEFLRTKRGNENSYNASNSKSYSTNGINLEFATTYSDVYNTYKGLIALRKANPAAFGGNKNAKAEKVSSGVAKYTTGDFLVYFNATDAAANISSTGYSKVIDVTSGTPAESTTLPASVPAKGFVILKK